MNRTSNVIPREIFCNKVEKKCKEQLWKDGDFFEGMLDGEVLDKHETNINPYAYNFLHQDLYKGMIFFASNGS